MRQHEFRLQFAVFADHRVDGFLSGLDRIIAGIEETDLRSEDSSGARGFGAADFLDALDGHAGLLPRALAFAALAEREAENADAIAARGVKRDGAAGAPYEIGGMGAHHENASFDQP